MTTIKIKKPAVKPAQTGANAKQAFAAAKAKGHAVIASDLAKSEKSEGLQANSPVRTRDDMKGFLRQHPVTGQLLGHVFNVWRRSTARRAGSGGYWAAQLHSWWSERTKLPVATLKRHLERLEGHGLIERQRGPFAGTPGVSFIRPTALALSVSDTRVSDRKHLGLEPGTKKLNTPAGKQSPAPAKLPTPTEKPASLEDVLAILSAGNEEPKSPSC